MIFFEEKGEGTFSLVLLTKINRGNRVSYRYLNFSWNKAKKIYVLFFVLNNYS
jgi:hypothetical protein